MTEPLALGTLLEWPDDGSATMPEPLRAAYDGGLSIDAPTVYANFVSSLDGVVSLGPTVAPSVVAAQSAADRFVLALLRARADTVIVGAGTLRPEPRGSWTPAFVYPELAPAFAEWRRTLGLAPDPRLVVLTRSGDLDPSMPALRGALVLTTEAGAGVIRDRGVPAEVEVLGERTVDVGEAVARARGLGYGTLLTEGGPHVLGEFLRAELLDELFLTLSPTIAGRAGPGRLGLVEGTAFEPDALERASLRSLKTHGSHLFLRYAIRGRDAG